MGTIRADQRPHLLYITDSVGIGGAELYLRTLLLHADRQQYQVGLLLPPRAALQPLIADARAGGVTVSFLDQIHHEGLSPSAILRAAAAIRALRPAIAHFVLPSPRRCAEAIIAAALARVPRRLVTFQLVTPMPRFGRLSGFLRSWNRRLQYRSLHAGIAVSSGNMRLLIEQYRFSAARLHLIANGVDTNYFQPRPDGRVLRETWGIPAGAPLLGVVGRLSRQKGHEILFAALPQVWASHPEAHVALIGSGELEASLRAQASELDHHERIHFVGQQRHMPEALAALDLFVLPSLYEGLPFVVLEAMAMERAVVATAVDGTAEVIEDGRTGLLVEPGAVEPLALAIVRLLGDAGLRYELGCAARTRVAAHFNQQQMLDRTFALYE
jgi:glycosyltransferase involved in cell wall biosynthesis